MLKKLLKKETEASTSVSNEIGFGSRSFKYANRLIDENGEYNVEHKNRRFDPNPYHWLINMSWPQYFLVVIAIFFLTNVAFAVIYFLLGVENLSGIDEASPFEQFLYCVYFSTQTLTSVGYGYISPVGHLENLIAALEATIGLAGFAFVTGISYGRFSKAKSKLQFSPNVVIAPFGEGTGLMFRVVNSRKNKLMNMEASISFSFVDNTVNAEKRIYRALPLQISSINLFPLPWTIVHPIEEEGLLHQITQEDLVEMDAELIIIIKGYDDTFNQQIHQTHSYRYDEFVVGAKFKPMFETDRHHGKVVIDLNKLGDYEITSL